MKEQWESGFIGPKEFAYSPTAISMYLECERKFAWRYVGKEYGPTNASAALGTRVHKALEDHLATGEMLDYSTHEGRIADSGLQFIPKPLTPGMQIEREFRFRGPSGRWYTGKADLLLPPDGEHPSVRVYDHKTTKDFKWMKSVEVLKKDPQAIIYAHEAMQTFRTNYASLKWVYYRTEKPYKALPVVVDLHSMAVREEFFAIEVVTERMQTILQSGRHPLEHVANPAMCEKYNGCPYRHLCNLSPGERMRSIMSQGTADLMANLEKKNGASPSTGNTLDSLLGGIVKDVSPPPATPGITFTESWKDAPEGKTVTEQIAASRSLDAAFPQPEYAPPGPKDPAINPPEWQPPPTAAEVLEAKEAEKEEKTPAKRGRKPKLPPEAVLDTPAPSAAAAQEVTDGYVLYVDCAPIGHAVTLAEEIYAIARKMVLERHGLADYRFADYGKGKGFFAQCIEEVVGSRRSGAIYVATGTDEASIALASLILGARLVVRGTR